MLSRNCVQLGYFAGFLAGVFVDRLSSYLVFIVAAALSGVSYGTISLATNLENNASSQALIVVHLIIAGYAAGLATINALVSTIKNFNRVLAILPIALFVCYMKLSQNADDAIHHLFFAETTISSYLLYVALFTAAVYLLSVIFCRKIDMTPEHSRECADSDGYGFAIYYVLLLLYILHIFFGVYVFDDPD